MNVSQARTAAADVLGQIAAGTDPGVTRKVNRQSPTWRTMFDEFVELPTRTKAKRPKSPKTVKDYRLQFERYLADWHNRKLSSVARQEIERLHNRLAETSGQYTANRVLSLVKALYNSAIELGYLRRESCSWSPSVAGADAGAISDRRGTARFFAAVEAEPSEKVRDFVWLALWTGRRRSNVLAMRWADVDLSRAIWTMPSTKTGRHAVPLTEPALEILRRRQNDANGCDMFCRVGTVGAT